MTSQGALMTTRVYFFASVNASRWWSLTMNRWVGLGLSTRTEKRLRAHPSAGLTEA